MSLDKRCPYCNINDATMIDDEDEMFEKGFRYYCSVCETYYQTPVVDLLELKMFLLKHTKMQRQGGQGTNTKTRPLRYILYEDIMEELK